MSFDPLFLVQVCSLFILNDHRADRKLDFVDQSLSTALSLVTNLSFNKCVWPILYGIVFQGFTSKGSLDNGVEQMCTVGMSAP